MKSFFTIISIFFIFPVSSQNGEVKTLAKQEIIADSLALLQIYDALVGSNWSPSVNWTTAPLKDWNRISLNAEGTRVNHVDLSGLGAIGNMTNPFTGDAVGGLSAIETFNMANNQITGLMDFSETCITNLNVSGNSLHFDDLEPLKEISTLDYSNQSSIQFEQASMIPIKIRHGENFNLSLILGGSDNQYQWKRNGVNITTSAYYVDNGDHLEIKNIDYENMGEYSVEVTSPTLVAGLTIAVEPQLVLAAGDLEVHVVDSDGQPIAENVTGTLLYLFRTNNKGFDTLAVASNVTSTFTIQDVVLGNYLFAVSSDPYKYIDTYYGDGFLWEYADTLYFRTNDPVSLSIKEIPLTGIDFGTGLVSGTVETDFSEESRKRVSKVKVGLMRWRAHEGGGRTDSSEGHYDLIAYGDTNGQGEFEFGFLPEGMFRFFVECPGIRMDRDTFVQFEIAEPGKGSTEFVLAAVITEESIGVELVEESGAISGELGIVSKYFENLEVYPNPSSDVLKISYSHLATDAVKVELVDLTGAILHQQDLQRGYDRDLTIDLTSFEVGIYVLRFYDTGSHEKNMMSYRIIVRD